jgi:Icc protein
MYIAQVTDIHIGASSTSIRNIRVRKQFLQILQVLSTLKLDLVIFSGDLAAINGEIEAYKWIKQELNKFPHKYIIMAGNHDILANMKILIANKNHIKNGMLYFSYELEKQLLMFLDTSSDTLPQEQCKWLQQQAELNKNREIFLFMHHPPLLCEVQFMDANYPLKNHSEVWQLLQEIPNIKHIFCGHYHTEKTIIKQNKCVYITPSTMMQLSQNHAKYKVDHNIPGWRIINYKNDTLFTNVGFSLNST